MLPRAWPEGSRKGGSGSGGNSAKMHVGRQQPATGSHLPLEDTALPFAVAPFASSPFAHPSP